MKKIIGIMFIITLLVTSTVMSGGLELKPYGFLKGEMVYTTKGVLSFNSPNIAAAQLANGVDNSAIGFTAQHSRFGLKGTAGEEIKVGGTLELDFYVGGFDANAKPRIRLAYASMAKGNMELRFGQQWDLYSPNIPITNNTNGNMWYAGNHGFRRAQIQLHYKMPVEGLSPLLQLSIGEGAKEESALGADNLSGLPMLQGRLSAKLMKKHTVGFYFAYAKFSPEPDTSSYDYNTTGFGVDFDFPFSPMLALKGEVNLGTNLNNANLFCIAGNGSKDVDKKNMGIWVNALSKPSAKLHLVGGFGMDKNQTDNLATGATDQNTVIYGDVILPCGDSFSVTFEVQNISTKIKNGDTNSALVIGVAGKVNF